MYPLNNYSAFYKTLYDTIGGLTPLNIDCGRLCGKACCKGDSSRGMLLFPHEETALDLTDFIVTDTDMGKVAVCSGKCNRENRPLACRMFPVFPMLCDDGIIRTVYDVRGYSMCPIVKKCTEIRLNKDFARKVRRAGRLLSIDPECREFLISTSKEIEQLYKLVNIPRDGFTAHFR